MASRSAVHKDDEFFKRVIDKCWPRIKEDLHPIYVLDILQRDGFLEYRDVRDIRDSKVTSEMNEQILRQFRAKGKAGYEKFKKCLEECKQQDLADYLTSTERERAEELNRNTGRRADQETDRIGNVKETTVGFSQLSIGQAKVGNGNQASQDTTVGSGNQGQTLTVDETDNVPSEKGTVTAVQPQSALSDGPSNDHSVGDRASGKEDRDKRLKEIFESEKVMRGRLKVLTDGNIKDLLDSCDQEARYRGGSGEVFVSKEKIPGLNMHIVVKKVKSEKGHTASKIGSLPSEKLNARILHFAIVPLLGISEDVENRTYYLLSPYMENGNLNQAIEEDCRRDNVVLDVSCRVKIMYQIASAIDFLHTPVKDIRGIIIHRDIKTLNIVLDKNNNARLTDFGLAQELKEGQDSTETTSTRPAHTPGYSRRTQEISGHNDYLAFGVVIRELLTGKKPIIEHGKNPKKVTMLKDLSERIIKQDSLAMWKNLDPNLKILEQLFKLSKMCIKEKEVTSEKVLKDVMVM